jgi:general stress protein 26
MRHHDQGSLDELRAMLKNFHVAMLITLDGERTIRSRPMMVNDPADLPGCDLWFVTGEDTDKVRAIRADQVVGVSCYRDRDGAYLSISGTAMVDRDSAAIERAWKPGMGEWFPDGPRTPGLALIKVYVLHAEYWEPAGGKLRVLTSKVKRIFTGRRADADLPAPKHI